MYVGSSATEFKRRSRIPRGKHCAKISLLCNKDSALLFAEILNIFFRNFLYHEYTVFRHVKVKLRRTFYLLFYFHPVGNVILRYNVKGSTVVDVDVYQGRTDRYSIPANLIFEGGKDGPWGAVLPCYFCKISSKPPMPIAKCHTFSKFQFTYSVQCSIFLLSWRMYLGLVDVNKNIRRCMHIHKYVLFFDKPEDDWYWVGWVLGDGGEWAKISGKKKVGQIGFSSGPKRSNKEAPLQLPSLRRTDICIYWRKNVYKSQPCWPGLSPDRREGGGRDRNPFYPIVHTLTA